MSGSLGTAALQGAPSWIYQPTGTDCEPGKFITDSPQSSLTTWILISGWGESGSDASFIGDVTVGSTIVFTDRVGRFASFGISDTAFEENAQGQIYRLSLFNPKGNIAWGGRYSINFEVAA